MNDNKRIAEWLKDELDGDVIVGGWKDDVLTIGMPSGKRFCVFDPSTDITLWHGDDGLLKKIEENAIVFNFLSALCGELNANTPINGTFVWRALSASPAQLTSALVKTIKETSCTQEE